MYTGTCFIQVHDQFVYIQIILNVFLDLRYTNCTQNYCSSLLSSGVSSYHHLTIAVETTDTITSLYFPIIYISISQDLLAYVSYYIVILIQLECINLHYYYYLRHVAPLPVDCVYISVTAASPQTLLIPTSVSSQVRQFTGDTAVYLTINAFSYTHNLQGGNLGERAGYGV